MAHAYFVVGETEQGIAAAHAFAEKELGLSAQGNPDVMTLRYGLLSVEDARKLRELAELAPVHGERKAIIISASRLFHEAQNALLKLFEEPPAGTTLILVIPAEGMLLPTLRSRLLELPGDVGARSDVASEFFALKSAEREKFITKLIDRTKSDKDEEKQAARLTAIQLVEGLISRTHTAWLDAKPAKQRELQLFLEDANTFLPILHERSAPLKMIFEHLQLTMPSGL